MPYSDYACAYDVKDEAGGFASFTGIASTDDPDANGNVIVAGAFEPIPTKANGAPDVLLLRDHDTTQVIGGWKAIRRDGNALVAEGELCLEVEKGRETYALLKKGYLNGLSVGWSARHEDVRYDDKNRRRIFKKARLAEVSIVGMPANKRARVVGVNASDMLSLLQASLSAEEMAILLDEGWATLIAKRKRPDPPPDVSPALAAELRGLLADLKRARA